MNVPVLEDTLAAIVVVAWVVGGISNLFLVWSVAKGREGSAEKQQIWLILDRLNWAGMAFAALVMFAFGPLIYMGSAWNFWRRGRDRS